MCVDWKRKAPGLDGMVSAFHFLVISHLELHGSLLLYAQVEVETLDPTCVVNLAAHPELGVGAELPRGRERLSLTVRRVLRVRNLLKR